MLPLTHKDKRSSLGLRIRNKLFELKRQIFADKNSRNLFLFVLLNLSFAFVEVFYGLATNSLGEWLCVFSRVCSVCVRVIDCIMAGR